MAVLQLKSLHPLFKLSTFLGIMPPYSYKTNSLIFTRFYRTYCWFILVYCIVGSSYGYVDESWYLFQFLQGPMRTVNILVYSSYFVQIVTTIVSSNLSNFKNLNTLLKDLVMVETKLAQFDTEKRRRTGFIWLELIVTHVLFLAVLSLDWFLWFKVSGNRFHFYMFHHNLQRYYTIVSVELMCNIMLYMKDQFAAANEMLERTVKIRSVKAVPSKIIFTITDRRDGPKDVIKLFLMLNGAIERFNRVYGWTILCVNSTITTGILASLNFMIQYKAKASALTADYGVSFLVLMTFWALVSLAVGVYLTSVANATVKEARSTSNVCYKLLSSIPVTSPHPEDTELREDLLLLSEQTAMRSPRFTAAGFFDVDYTMLFTMLSAITSYLVVTMQFN